MNTIVDWVQTHPALVGAISVTSLLLLVTSAMLMPWLVSRLPTNYLIEQSRPRSERQSRRPLAMLVLLLRTVIGLFLVLLGIVMLITPGPGIVALLLGLTLVEFPGKHHLLVHVASRPGVFSSLNWIRARHGQPPFEHPTED
ncbi:MAG: hypothetical protein CSB44_02825 [Gammaproteobacteria bacterium]|nr:MAG: hypothetical protein CSB44_02825 [Gammaproteobacteria bacterium]PIE34996.1 MAG: hypothetical protein CSA54_06080 [Gammaproteobacteria bacterium]